MPKQKIFSAPLSKETDSIAGSHDTVSSGKLFVKGLRPGEALTLGRFACYKATTEFNLEGRRRDAAKVFIDNEEKV